MLSHSPGGELRALLARGPVPIVGAFNALCGRMAERVGFRCVYLSGAALSAGVGCVPDAGVMTMPEFVAQARYLTSAVSIPVLADADTGFGDERSIARTVREYEAAGLAGLHLEDQAWPKRCGHLPGKRVVPVEEMTARLRAACAARRDEAFLIVARTDARSVEGLQAAVERGLAYRIAGADAVFPEALESAAEFAEFARSVPGPLIANATEFGKSPLLPVDEFGRLGYAGVLFPATVFRAAMGEAERALRALFEAGTQSEWLERMLTRRALYEYLDYDPSGA